jgi:hypothetical protein
MKGINQLSPIDYDFALVDHNFNIEMEWSGEVNLVETQAHLYQLFEETKTLWNPNQVYILFAPVENGYVMIGNQKQFVVESTTSKAISDFIERELPHLQAQGSWEFVGLETSIQGAVRVALPENHLPSQLIVSSDEGRYPLPHKLWTGDKVDEISTLWFQPIDDQAWCYLSARIDCEGEITARLELGLSLLNSGNDSRDGDICTPSGIKLSIWRNIQHSMVAHTLNHLSLLGWSVRVR